MNVKIKKVILLLLAATLIIISSAGAAVKTYAETAEEVQTEEQLAQDGEIDTVEDGADFNEVVERFTEYLKEAYGADYDYYYNLIISQWGSIENYLLAFGDYLPEEARNGWETFISWLSEYAPIWATALAIIALIVALILRKRQMRTVVEQTVAPIVKELNAQSKATATMMRSQKALLGTNGKFSEVVQDLDESEKELTGDE